MLDKIKEFRNKNKLALVVAWAVLTVSAVAAMLEGLQALASILFFVAGVLGGVERTGDKGLTYGLGTFLMYASPLVGLLSGTGYSLLVGGIGAAMAFGVLIGEKRE